MEIDENGDILIANYDALGGTGAIIRIDPFSGNQSIISSGGYFSNPAELALDSSGNIFVADQNAFSGNGGIIQVDPLTGTQTIVTSAGGPVSPIGIDFDASGQLLSTSVLTSPSIMSINPLTLVLSPVSHDNPIAGPGGLEVESDGNILVSSVQALGGDGSIQRIDPDTGEQSTLSSGFTELYNISIDGSGNIWAANGSAAPAVVKVDPGTGAQTVVSSGGSLGNPVGIHAVLQDSGPAPDVSTSTDTIDTWDDPADWGGTGPGADDAVVIETTSGGTISGPENATQIRSLLLDAAAGSPELTELVLTNGDLVDFIVTHGVEVGPNGALSGVATLIADVKNAGFILPGFSPGTMTIDGNFTQDAVGTLLVELGGLLPSDEYDVLNVTGTAVLDGALEVVLYDLGGGLFSPSAGDTFDILTAELITGSFDTLTLAALGVGLDWDLSFLTDEIGSTDVLRLSVIETSAIPVPAAVWLFGSGLIGLVGIAHRRKNVA